MAQYTIKRITLPNGDICTLRVENMEAATMEEAVAYLALPGQYSGDIDDIEIATLAEAMEYLGIASGGGDNGNQG